MNTLKNSKMFCQIDNIKKFSQKMAKYDLSNYYVPKDLYKTRLDSMKGFKIPLTKEVLRYVENDKIIPVLFTESNGRGKSVLPNLHTDVGFPYSIFNLVSSGPNGPIALADLSHKGKYLKNKSGEIEFLDIPDIQMQYFFIAAYIHQRLYENPELQTNSDLMTLVAESYSFILSRIIDSMFLVTSANNVEYNKLFFLCSCFAYQNFFGLDKDTAVEKAIKMKMVIDKRGVQSESYYITSPENFMANLDYNTRFPIDNFVDIMLKEYQYLDPKKFNVPTLMIRCMDRLTRNATFAIETIVPFITMLVLSKGSLGIFNDTMIKSYIELSSKDFLKEIEIIVK